MNGRRLRCLVVWLTVTATAGAVAGWSLSGVRLGGPFDRLLVDVAALVLGGCAVWAWLVTTVVVAQALRHGHRAATTARGVPRWARRAVLAACGLAVLTAVPAHAQSDVSVDDGARTVDGLPFPDRATGPGRVARADPGPDPIRVGLADTARTHVVRPGESLWSISADRLPPDAPAARIARATSELYEQNRPVVGADRDLIHPDQQLRLPAHPHRGEDRP